MKVLLRRTLLILGVFYLHIADGQIPSTYKKFLIQRMHFDSAKILMEEGEYANALRAFSGLYDNVDLSLSSHKKAAICNLRLGDRASAIDHIKKAIGKGYKLDFLLNDPELNPLKNEIQAAYAVIRPHYLSTIDTALRTDLYRMLLADQSIRQSLMNNHVLDRDSVKRIMLIVDSVNISKLKQIESKIGWPGITEIGSDQTFDIQMPDVNLIVRHSNEANNLFFLQSAIGKARQGKASWRDPFGIMTNLCFRFNQDDGHIKLRNIFFEDDGTLDEENSFLQLMAIANFMQDNEQRKLTLKKVNWTGVARSVDLQQVKRFLVKNGVSEGRIVVSDHFVFGKDDGLGKYTVVGGWNW